MTPPGLSDAGLPRPKRPWRHASTTPDRCPELPDELPVPWINEPGDFGLFRAECARAHHERLCSICGLALHHRVVLGAKDGQNMTAGPGGHPRCMLLAVSRCPHLVELSGTVAWEHVGPGVGYDVTRTLAERGCRVDVDEYVAGELGSGEYVSAGATALTRQQLAELARTDPWGRTPAAGD